MNIRHVDMNERNISSPFLFSFYFLYSPVLIYSPCLFSCLVVSRLLSFRLPSCPYFLFSPLLFFPCFLPFLSNLLCLSPLSSPICISSLCLSSHLICSPLLSSFLLPPFFLVLFSSPNLPSLILPLLSSVVTLFPPFLS